MKLLPFLRLHIRVLLVSFGVIEAVEVRLLIQFPCVIVKIVLFNKQELVKWLHCSVQSQNSSFRGSWQSFCLNTFNYCLFRDFLKNSVWELIHHFLWVTQSFGSLVYRKNLVSNAVKIMFKTKPNCGLSIYILLKRANNITQFNQVQYFNKLFA